MKVIKAPIDPESKVLVYALAFTFLCHGAAMIAMLAFLLPGMPGGTADLAHRISYISDHAVIWKLGWFPWQLTALSDLILAIALLRTTWISKPLAVGSLVFTVLALAFEQPSEFQWTTSGIEIAREAIRTGNTAPYAAFEQHAFSLTSHWAAFFYTVAAIFWSVAFFKGGAWHRSMTWLSVVLWGLLIFVSVGPLVSPIFGPNVVSVGNAIGFNLMMLWFAVAFVLVKQRR